MGKVQTNALIEGGLVKRGTMTRLTLLSGEPTSITDISNLPDGSPAGKQLAFVTITGGNFTISNGAVSGRRSTLAAVVAANTFSGTANHVCLDDGTDWEATTCTPQGITQGGTAAVGAHDREILAPT